MGFDLPILPRKKLQQKCSKGFFPLADKIFKTVDIQVYSSNFMDRKNARTYDSESVSLGSNPSPGAQRNASRLLIVFLAGAFFSLNVHAAATEWRVNPNGQVRLIAEADGVPRQGTLLLGFQFKTAPGWYVYWKVAGDAGFAPNVKWGGSAGLKNPQFLWPAPTKFVLPGNIIEYGYEKEVVYPVRAALNPKGDTVHVSATISYLTCYTACVPYKYNFSLDLPVQKVEADPEPKALIDRFLAEVPPAGKTDEEIERAAPTVVINPIPVSEAPAPQNPLSTAALFLLAFCGGRLLNVMPCVLPVLAIKLLGLVKQAGHFRHVIMRNSLLSAAGIVTSFVGLGAVAAAAKVGGRAVGWGIQFQNPIFVMALAVIVFLFALNLWGVFEIGMPRIFGHFAVTYGQRETPAAHFMSGLFATLLATPCSAPFLGTAMGFALTQPAPTIFAAFFIAGCGMALPYFALAIFPGSLGWLPKPGLWMVRLKAFFGILLAATALWLVWVFLEQVRPIPHEAFTESAIQTLLAVNKPVFVDVTADWCVTCKYNERFVLNSSDVKRAFERRGIVILRADWTNRDETIRQYLAKFGRSGIPFYAFYEPGKEPVALSEFLTARKVLDVLNK
jgi:thiol:disulfide interchange protein